MRELRITEHTETIVMKWKAGATPEDRQRVEKLLAAIADLSAMKGKFHWEKDSTDPTITVFKPREGLLVLVRMWTDDPANNPDQFDVVTIVDAGDLSGT
ncbi:hypothetical protein [Streptosporangium sp. NPDC049644]|uniref:hypothetical protein n=1 Tax=Streptosporangium sp. NPDC049644 TaxID=3155507 RepID=UPI00341A5AAD